MSEGLVWKKWLWIGITALVLGWWFYSQEVAIRHIYIWNLKSLVLLALFVALILVINFALGVQENLGIQKLRNQPSWIFYGLWGGVVIAPLLASVLLVTTNHLHVSPWVFLLNFVVAFSGVLIWICVEPTDINLKPLRFAAGSVGIEDDAFGFKESADATAAALMKIEENVSAIFIYGSQGYGKSSYARMVIENENFPRDKTLYTYISLTETNEAKDFSKLFAERWMDTLQERYPKMDTSLAVPFMQSVLRESGNGLVASVLSVIPGLNKGLLQTRAKYFDRWYRPADPSAFLDDSVANIFGNVPEFREKLWIVMIDEIERALPNEIYRVVEVVERFKNEGRTGIPIKVLFLMCISDDVLRERFESFKKRNYKISLLEDFFASKSGIPPRYIPPVSTDLKLRFIQGLVKEFNDGYAEKPFSGTDLDDLFQAAERQPILSIEKRYESDAGKRLSQSLRWLVKESPRFLYREMQGLRFSYDIYSRKGVRIPVILDQFLMIEYVRVKYPIIWHFFLQTIEEVRDAYNWDQRMDSANPRVLSRALEQHFEKKKRRLADQVAEITGETILEEEKPIIEGLIGDICYWYVDYFTEENHPLSERVKYFRTFNDPNVLYSYLTNIENKGSDLEQLFTIYTEHQEKGASILKNLDFQRLLEYSRFTTDLRTRVRINIYADVAKEIASRIIVPPESSDSKRMTYQVYHDSAYQLAYLIMHISELVKQGASAKSGKELDEVFDKCFVEVLNSNNVPFEYKFILLNSLGNETRGSGSEIHFRLAEAFKFLEKKYGPRVRAAITRMFEDYEHKYYEGEAVIYENEENFFYVMYQSWSGNPESVEEIEEIRTIAKRGLESHHDAIIKYWNRYPYQEEWRDSSYSTGQFSLRMDFDGGGELYMPLKTLIEISEKTGDIKGLEPDKVQLWKRWLESGEYVPPPVREDKNTLRAVLRATGYSK